MTSTSQPASVRLSTAASVPGKRTFPSLFRPSSVGRVTNSTFGMAPEPTDRPGPRPGAGRLSRRARRGARTAAREIATVATAGSTGVDCARPAGPVLPAPQTNVDESRPQGGQMSPSASEIPDTPFFQTAGDRRSIRYYDPDRKVED